MPNDPFADAMNTSGYAGLIGPNPYLEYTGQIPMAGYRGAPTDAAGNPIASFTQAQQQHDAWNAANPAPAAPAAGTTLNSTPQQAPIRMASQSSGMPQGWNQNSNNGGLFITPPMQVRGVSPQTQAAPAAAAAPTNPIDMRQAYLDALSNPGKATTPGAQMLPGATPTGPQSQPSVLAQFLQQHPGGGATGAGGYSNTGFFNTLNALKQGGSS